ncbi:MAG: diaminopimelate epimerase [Deltaproteobacteria bacterium]|nr:diaminopimelate epimerase [Deltaproteobacteria bacterium]
MATNGKGKLRPFHKMYATGNDFIIFDCQKALIDQPNKVARQLLHRRNGIGGDQLLLIRKSRVANFRMQAFNPDGSEAEMCGNGVRCVGKYLFDTGLGKKVVTIETLGGVREVKSHGNTYRVDMGEPKLKGKEIPVNLNGRIINRPLKLEGREFRVTCISVGNPHCVIFVDDPETFPVEKYGPLIENFHIFPRRTNVEFARATSPAEVELRVWERGTGETEGCGTGACATGVAAVLNGLADRKVAVNQRGGKVTVEWDRDTNHVYLMGPAQLQFTGQVTV